MGERKRFLVIIGLKYDDDVVLARQKARQIAKLLGFSNLMQVQIATAVSEIARNVVLYANFGKVEFYIDSDNLADRLMIRISDNGSGIKSIDEVLKGNYKSKSGMGIGIKGSRILMDYFHIESKAGEGTTIVMGKTLPHGKRITEADLGRITTELQKLGPINAYDEIKEQNRELIELLDNLTRQKNELEKLNRELSDKNRGIQSLYNELQDRVNQLNEAIKLKNKFIYYITHEFKTPVTSIIYLTSLIMKEKDSLTEEQKKQIGFIRKAAESILNLIDEMLGLARYENGSLRVKPVNFNVSDLFSSLRGIFDVLNTNKNVKLEFKIKRNIPSLYSDMDKIAQILKNLIINALKFTRKGEVSVEATLDKEKTRVLFRVKDTGIGIPREMQGKIFEDYQQVGESYFNGVKGTGLGLSVSKKIAKLLGGDILLEKSIPGKGSIFLLWIPMNYNKSKSFMEK